MIKLRSSFFKITFISSVLLFLSACGGTKHFIIPINKNINGNISVTDITVTTSSGIKSAPLASRVKAAVLKETIKRLKGSHEVKLKINIHDWRPAYNFNNVKTGNQRTTLGITVTILDAKTSAVVGKYKTGAFYHNDHNVTASGNNTNKHIIETTAYFAAWHLEK